MYSYVLEKKQAKELMRYGLVNVLLLQKDYQGLMHVKLYLVKTGKKV